MRSLEFFLADSCNLSCAACAAASPYLSDASFPSLGEFREALLLLKPVLRAGQLKLLGGEPLLNPDAPLFSRAARESGIFDAVRVTTNGLLLPRMGEEFWSSVDVVEISSYPGIELDESRLARGQELAARFGARVEIVRHDAFFRSFSDTPAGDAGIIERVYRACGETVWCPTLRGRRIYRCSRVAGIDRYLTAAGVPHPAFELEDGLELEEGAGLLERLEAYLESPHPLGACAYCYGTSGKRAPHRQIGADERAARLSGEAFEPFDPGQLEPAGSPPARSWRRSAAGWLRRSLSFSGRPALPPSHEAPTDRGRPRS